MQDILFDYEIKPTTWAYLSGLLTIGIYFKFRRFWSVRNLDLIALIGFSPGILLVFYGLQKQSPGLEQLGYIWLFGVALFFVIRLLLDLVMVRRPLLEPNLSASGLTFTGVALLVFLLTNLITPKPAERLEHLLPWQQGTVEQVPGYSPLYSLAAASGETKSIETTEPRAYRRALLRVAAARATAIVAYLAVVIGIVLIGYRHFDNIHTGVAVASLYLLLLYTSQMTGRLDHLVPAAMLVWATEAYRRPTVAGIFLGLAAVVFYPLFLLPLWCSFYWKRGLIRFAIGVVASLVLLIVLLAFVSGSVDSFLAGLKQMFGGTCLSPGGVAGFWQYHEPAYRIPVIALFVALCGGLAIWPAQKNLGTLLSCSAAVMLGAQFWHAYEGGLYMAWFLPLLLLTVFRPNLEDRVALTALTEGWLPWRKNGSSGS